MPILTSEAYVWNIKPRARSFVPNFAAENGGIEPQTLGGSALFSKQA